MVFSDASYCKNWSPGQVNTLDAMTAYGERITPLILILASRPSGQPHVPATLPSSIEPYIPIELVSEAVWIVWRKVSCH